MKRDLHAEPDTGREDIQPLSLYLHIPFCVRKCRYCDFLSAPSDEETRERYTQALCREIRTAAAAGNCPGAEGGDRSGVEDRGIAGTEVDTVFFGGGTPSLLTPGQLERILETIRACFFLRDDAEITLEANPGTLDLAGLRTLRSLGINRLSLGVQSFRDGELVLLGRIHSAEQALHSCRDVQEAGFDNWSMDLMSGLPGQTLAHWMETLQTAAGLEPPHLSAYSLILEEGTPLASLYAAHKLPPLPSEEEDRAMVHETSAYLASLGLLRYEISNYARPGFESRHNSGYWTGHEYLGLGLGASSCVGGQRFRNTMDLGKYLEVLKREEYESSDTNPAQASRRLDLLREDVTLLSRQDRMEEFMFLGLRMTRGVSVADFCRRFGTPLTEVYGAVLDRQLRTGLLRKEGDRYYLTEDGLDVSNTLMAEYLME